MTSRITIASTELPEGDNVSFSSSTFFKQIPRRRFPTPAEVKERALLVNHTNPEEWRPPPVYFPALNLLVKYGGAASVAEGQALWMIRKYLGHIVTVPEIYGWRKDGTETFLYMQLIPGVTLEKRWKSLSSDERLNICDQLRPMVVALQRLNQTPPQGWVGKPLTPPRHSPWPSDQRSRIDIWLTVMTGIGGIKHGEFQDVIFQGYSVGPFPDSHTFHEWFVLPRWERKPTEIEPLPYGPDPLRGGLADSDPVRFVHADINRGNIMVSAEGEGPPRVQAIIDWHQSGWYPASWEYCKARYTVDVEDKEWLETCLPRIMEPRNEAYLSWNYFCLCHAV